MTIKTSPRPVVGPQTDHEPLNAARWSSWDGRDGIVGDFSGNSYRVRNQLGVSTGVSIGYVGDEALVRGHLAQIVGAFETIDLGVVGVQPSANQERFSRIVARFHLTGTFQNLVRVEAIVGSPANSGSGVTPPAVRTADSWDLSLAVVRQAGTNGPVTGITDHRQWSGDHAEVSVAGILSGSLGCTRGQGSTLYRRSLVNDTPTWLAHDAADPTGSYVNGQVSAINPSTTSTTTVAVKNPVAVRSDRRYLLSYSARVDTTSSTGTGFELEVIDGGTPHTSRGWVTGAEDSRAVTVSASVVYEPTAGNKAIGVRLTRLSGSGSLTITGARWHIIDIGPRS